MLRRIVRAGGDKILRRASRVDKVDEYDRQAFA
jgi:hypothetical protein